LLQEVADYLDARRVIGTRLQVVGPRYLPINVTANVSIWRLGREQATVEERVKEDLRTKIARYLHPLYGGPDGNGWSIGQDFLMSGLLEFIQPDPAIGFISRITVAAGTPLYTPPTRPVVGNSDVWVQLADYEIMCSGTHTVNVVRLQ
jgi:hypothetical protein